MNDGLCQINGCRSWTCSECTFVNSLNPDICEVCGFNQTLSNAGYNGDAKPERESSFFNNLTRDMSKVVKSIKSAVSTTGGGNKQPVILYHPPPSANGQTQPYRRPNHQLVTRSWKCQVCTFAMNRVTSTLCEVCGNERAGTSKQSWACRACTFDNTNNNLTYCEVCSAPRIDTAAEESSANGDQFGDFMPSSEQSELLEDFQETCQTYSTILLNCRRSQSQFLDPYFPCNVSSLFYNASHPTTDDDTETWKEWVTNIQQVFWQRPYLISSGTWTVCNDCSPSDIQQGGVGDCWAVSAISLVACSAVMLQKVIITPDWNDAGAYMIRLCIDGVWQLVIVDDMFPFYQRSLRYMPRAITSTASRNQLWVPLIEKAMAKSFGCYEALIAGHVKEGLSVLTGEPVMSMDVPETSDDDFWVKLMSFCSAGFLLGASCGRTQSENCGGVARSVVKSIYESCGLVAHHAYAIIRVETLQLAGENGTEKIVQLRNPHGSADWNGAYNDRSSKWSKAKRLSDQKITHSGQSKGYFWMTLSDFCLYFSTIDVCKSRPNWFESRHLGEFTGNATIVSGVHSCHGHVVTIESTTSIEAMLYQHGVRQRPEYQRHSVDVMLMVFRLHDEGGENRTRFSRLDAKDFIAATPRKLDSFVNLDFQILSAGKYLVLSFSHYHVLSHDNSMTNEYTLALHSSAPLAVETMRLSASVMSDALICYAKATGQSRHLTDSVVCYNVLSKFSGLLFVCVNQSRDDRSVAKVTLDCSNASNVVSSRDATVVRQTLEAGEAAVLQILTHRQRREAWCVDYQVSCVVSRRKGGILRAVLDGEPDFVVADTPEEPKWLFGPKRKR